LTQIRTFIAIELDDALKAGLARVQAQLQDSPVSRAARWVSPHSIHLTLKFLGDVSSDRVGEIGRAMQRACDPFVPFTISLSGTGCFPNSRRARVIWVGLDGDLGELTRLQRSVEAELERIGFPAEDRDFHPHLTLARMRRQARRNECAEMGELVVLAKVEEGLSKTVREISLMRSDLRPGGAVYTRLLSIPLGRQQVSP
jgi:2'-5' RNA ligase